MSVNFRTCIGHVEKNAMRGKMFYKMYANIET